MSIQQKGTSRPDTHTDTYDVSYLTQWLELGQYTGFQSKVTLADFTNEADMKDKIKLWMNTVAPNWFLMNAGDGNTFCVVQVVVDRNRWTKEALNREFDNIVGASVGAFESWTGSWASQAQAGMNTNTEPTDVSAGALTDRSTAPAGYSSDNLDTAQKIAHFVRYDDQSNRESVTAFPTTDGLSQNDQNSIRCANGRRSLERTEALEYDVVYQQGTDAGFITFINYDLDGYTLDVGGASSQADAGATIGQASADWHVKGSMVEFILSELKPLAYTCNFNGDRTNATAIDGGTNFEMRTGYGVMMMIDRPLAECLDMLRRVRALVEENSMSKDINNTATGSQIAQANADRWWSKNYAINSAAAAGIANYADNTEIDTGDTGNADDLHVFQLPPYFADTSGY